MCIIEEVHGAIPGHEGRWGRRDVPSLETVLVGRYMARKGRWGRGADYGLEKEGEGAGKAGQESLQGWQKGRNFGLRYVRYVFDMKI